ncbi:phosphotransferase [Mycobacterium hubeiense]|uniref:phosphotransferase n=1 Tax=Mycobacterium hubeiense TaxID=1867256 RepID=UPI000C7F1F66|nr:phosphotransferase [Mycobacterium sp. QGD 101]
MSDFGVAGRAQRDQARRNRAVAAATAAGTDLGLRVCEPRVLYDVFSVIVHLAPSPVVVRVPTVLPQSLAADPQAQTAQQRRELAATGWLADRGHPVVPPSPLVPREPVRRDGFSMTFWQLVEQVPDTEPRRPFELTARLHAALRDYPGELEFLTQFNFVPDALAQLEHRPDLLDAADLQRAQREWQLIGPLISSRAAFEAAFPDANIQPIHGDAPYYNIIVTTDGELWSDFELVTLGPVEADLALVGAEGQAAYNEAAPRLGLRPLDERVLRVMESAGYLAVVACLSMAPQLSMLVESVAPALDEWRARQ